MALRIVPLATATLAAALLAGCVSIGGKAPASLFGLTPAKSAPAGAMGGGTLAEALVVLDPDTDRRLDVQRVPVQVDDANIAYLKDAVWVERPARLFRHLLAETIRANGGRLVLEGSDGAMGGKLTLSGRLIDMGYDARSLSAIVRYDAMRTDAAGQITVRRFEAVVPGVAADAASVGPALNRAANEVATAVAEWIG